MARERYLLNAEEDKIHGEAAPETPASKRKDWWDYNRRYVFLGLLLLAVIGFTIYSVATNVKPDYHVALLTKYPFPTSSIDNLGRYISDYGEDLNGDGQVVAYVSAYNLGSGDATGQDSPALQASIIRLTADFTTADSMIFIHDEESFNFVNNMETAGIWRYNSGETMPSEATDFENAVIPFDSFAAFRDYTPSAIADGEISSEEVRGIFSGFSVSRRSIENSGVKDDADVKKYFEACESLYGRLLTGEKPPRQEEK